MLQTEFFIYTYTRDYSQRYDIILSTNPWTSDTRVTSNNFKYLDLRKLFINKIHMLRYIQISQLFDITLQSLARIAEVPWYSTAPCHGSWAGHSIHDLSAGDCVAPGP